MLTMPSIDQRLSAFAGETRRTSHGALLPHHYDHLAFVTRGTFTEIHLVQDRETHGPRALKQLRSEWLDDARARQLLTNEIRVRRQIDHPYVPRFLDGGIDCERPFLVMEWVDGERLSDSFGRQSVPLRKLLWIARQCAFGLQLCHSAGYSHGQFGADSVLLAADGAVKLVDFSHSRNLQSVSADADGAPFTNGETISRLHHSPMSSVDPVAKDAYDMGCLLYWMLTGQSLTHRGRFAYLLDQTPAARSLTLGDCPVGTPKALVELINLLLAEAPSKIVATLDSISQELIDLELLTMSHPMR